MLSSSQWELRRPKDSALFEQLIRDVFSYHWKDPNASINGRSGQKQDGVDVYGQPLNSALWFGIQCKLRGEGGLTEAVLTNEIEMARGFRHKLNTYIFATTLPRDTYLQSLVENLNDSEVSNGSFKIQIRFWEDICALLDEHPNLIQKYYGRGGYVKMHQQIEYTEKPSEISENSPLLVGALIDVSKSMVDVLSKMPTKSGLSKKRFGEAANVLAEKIVAFCRTPESDDVLPRAAFFLYGYGFGSLRKSFANILSRIGINDLEPKLIPSAPVRDLFAEIASKESVPFTPKTSELNIWWPHYKASIEAQLLDIGSGISVLGEAAWIVVDRFRQELKREYYETPLLLLISDGGLADTSELELMKAITQIKAQGVQIVSCYVGTKNIMPSKTLPLTSKPSWPAEAKRLFECSSTISRQNEMSNEIAQIAIERGWNIPDSARLFVQINNSEMLDELIEVILSPIQNERDRNHT